MRVLPVMVGASASVSVFLAMVASAQPADPAAGPPGEPVAPPADPPAADIARRAKVLVRFDGGAVTVGQLEDRIHALSPFRRTRFLERPHLRAELEAMVRTELLAAEALRRHYASNEQVTRTIDQQAAQALLHEEVDAREQPSDIPMADVERYYREHEESFHRPELRRASHIQFASAEEAGRILDTLREADMRAFRQAARQYSTDAETKLRGGDLRYFSLRDRRPPRSTDAPVDPALVAAAFALEGRGSISAEPVQVGDRYSILMLTGHRAEERRTLVDAADGIRTLLWRQRREQRIRQLDARLRKQFQPEIYPDRVTPIELDLEPLERLGFNPHVRTARDRDTSEQPDPGPGTHPTEPHGHAH